jgi:hypothetical protein
MITENDIIEQLWSFADRYGRQPSFQEWHDGGYRPSTTTISVVCGSWANALVAAGMEGYPPGGEDRIKHDTHDAMLRVDGGESIASVARELGITGQALGRRIRRYRQAR